MGTAPAPGAVRRALAAHTSAQIRLNVLGLRTPFGPARGVPNGSRGGCPPNYFAGYCQTQSPCQGSMVLPGRTMLPPSSVSFQPME
jgi:hypothetical protein